MHGSFFGRGYPAIEISTPIPPFTEWSLTQFNYKWRIKKSLHSIVTKWKKIMVPRTTVLATTLCLYIEFVADTSACVRQPVNAPRLRFTCISLAASSLIILLWYTFHKIIIMQFKFRLHFFRSFVPWYRSDMDTMRVVVSVLIGSIQITLLNFILSSHEFLSRKQQPFRASIFSAISPHFGQAAVEYTHPAQCTACNGLGERTLTHAP